MLCLAAARCGVSPQISTTTNATTNHPPLSGLATPHLGLNSARDHLAKLEPLQPLLNYFRDFSNNPGPVLATTARFQRTFIGACRRFASKVKFPSTRGFGLFFTDAASR